MLHLISDAARVVLTFVTLDGDVRMKDFDNMRDCHNTKIAIWIAHNRDDKVLDRISCNPSSERRAQPSEDNPDRAGSFPLGRRHQGGGSPGPSGAGRSGR